MSNTLGDYGTPPDPLNVRLPDPRDARIAELEARNRKLEEALDDVLEIIDGLPTGDLRLSEIESARSARAALSTKEAEK